MKRIIRTLALCAVFAVLTAMAVFAATPAEMYENGVVSDGNISYHDARDGVVSDVSDPVGDEAGRIHNGFDGTATDGGNDHATGTHTGDDAGLNDTTMVGADRDGIARTGDTSTANNGANNTAAGSGSGMVWGVIIAIVVIVIVIAVIFWLMPKRRG